MYNQEKLVILSPDNTLLLKLFILLIPAEVAVIILFQYNSVITSIIGGFLGVVVASWLIMYKPYWALIFLLYSILWGPITALRIGSKMPNVFYADAILIFILSVLFVYTLMNKDEFSKLTIPTIAIFLAIFIFYAFIGISFSKDFLRGLGALKVYLVGFIAFLLSVNLLNSYERIKQFCYTVVIWGTVLSLMILYNVLFQFHILEVLFYKKVYLRMGRSNYIATFLVLVIPLVTSLIASKSSSKIIRLLFACIAIIMITALFLTGSRGGVLALVIAFMVLSMRLLRGKMRIYFLFFLFLIGISLYYNPSTALVKDRLINIETSESVFIRLSRWKESLKLFKENPLFGIGVGNLSHHLSQTSTFFGKAHNFGLSLLAESGIGGFFIFSLLIIRILKIQISNCRTIRHDFHNCLTWGTLSGTVGALAHSMVEPTLNGYLFAILFWIIIGMSFSHHRLINSETTAVSR